MTMTVADNRGRVLLGKDLAGSTYRVTEHPDGAILLEPAKVVSLTELAALANPRIAEGLKAAKDGTAKGVPFDWDRDSI